MFTWWSWQAGKRCPQIAMVLSTAAFLKMCQGWIVWNFAQEEYYYQWNNQQVKWFQPQALPVCKFLPWVHPSSRQESWNINVKCKECVGHCCWCTCVCSCAFWGQGVLRELGWGALKHCREYLKSGWQLPPAQPAPPSLPCSLCNGRNKTRNKLFILFFSPTLCIGHYFGAPHLFTPCLGALMSSTS